MRNRRLVWLLTLLAALSLVAAACGGDGDPGDDETGGTETTGEPTDEPTDGTTIETLEEGILTVGSDIPYPPFEIREGDELSGFDIDLIREIATRLGLETEIIDTGFVGIFAQLGAGSFDVVIAASTITPEREETVNFTDPYYLSNQALAVQSGSGITGVADLGEGHVVAVQDGTTGESWAEENLVPQGVELRAYPEGPDTYQALETGEVDGALNDEGTAVAEVDQRAGLEIVEVIETGEAYGIAVDPNNEPLLAAINEVLAEMIADGTYEEIFNRYPKLLPGGNIAARG